MQQGKRLSILTIPEAKELYSVPRFEAHERDYFFTFSDEELNAVKHLHSHRNRIHTLLMLGYFKVKPVCLIYDWSDIEGDYRYIASRYYPSASKHRVNITRFTRRRLYQKVTEQQDYQRFDKTIENQLEKHLLSRAKIYVEESQLFKDTIQFLKTKHVSIPAYSRLQNVISLAINTEETRLARLVDKHLKRPAELMSLIDKKQRISQLNNLKKYPRSHSSVEIDKELFRHQQLSSLADIVDALVAKLKLSEGNVQYYAQRCQYYNIKELREFKPQKAMLYIACFVTARMKLANDNLTQSFLVTYKTYYDQAVDYRESLFNLQASQLSANVGKVPLILSLFTDNTITDSVNFGDIRRRVFSIISKIQIPLVCKQLSDLKPDKAIFFWEYIDTPCKDVVDRLRAMFLALDFGCRENKLLQQQIDTAKKQLAEDKSSSTFDKRLLLRGDKRHLTPNVKDSTTEEETPERRYEYYLYKLLERGLKRGEVFVNNSLEYQSFDTYLVNNMVWKKRHKHLQDVGLSWMAKPAAIIVDEFRQIFNTQMRRVGKRIEEGKNTYVKKRKKSDRLRWSKAVTAKDSKLTERFFAHFDSQTIVNVIRKVNQETQFLQHLKQKEQSGKKSDIDIEYLLACIIGNGTFQGTYKFAAISDQQYKVLKRIEEECFHPEAMQKSNDSITGAALNLSIFDDIQLDDEDIHGSADGQRFESKYGNPFVDYNAKYFRQKKGAIIYTLVTSYFATHGKVIPARSHESHHLFDVLHNNTSDLQPTVILTDTHGTNQFNHAILHSFGYQFAPRYAQFKRRFLSEFSIDFNRENVLDLAQPINWKLIESEWENITKIMLSLGMRTAQQSTIVKRLCGFKQHNKTLRALTEYNRVFQCLHMLDYADDKQLRQVIQESLNRGESLHSLKRALAAVGGTRFRGQSPEEMERWNSCANLLANCIVYYNAMIMSSFKNHCVDTGKIKQLRHLQAISPASWENILLNGFYDLSENDEQWDVESKLKNLILAA